MLQPTFKNVLILPDKPRGEVRQESGIYLPQADSEPEDGVIVAIGPDVTAVTQKQRVHFRKFAGDVIDHEGSKFILMPEDDLLFVWES